LGSLAAFEAACRHLSFTRAAIELNLTQAAISRQIRALEAHLGTRLFERRRHDVVLTTEGLRFAADVNPALAVIGDATVSLKSGYVEEVTIFTEMCLAAHCLMPRLSRFQASNSNVSLRILTSNKSLEAETEQFDVGLSYGFSRSPVFQSEPIAVDKIIAVCSPAVRRTLPERCSARHLAQSNLISFEQRDTDWMGWAQFLAAFKARPQGSSRLIFNTYNSAIDAAIEGYGVALGWGHVVAKPLRDGRLVEIKGFEVPSPDPLCVHTRTDRPKRAALQSFASWMRSEVLDAAG